MREIVGTLMMHCTSLHEGDCGNTDDALYITA